MRVNCMESYMGLTENSKGPMSDKNSFIILKHCLIHNSAQSPKYWLTHLSQITTSPRQHYINTHYPPSHCLVSHVDWGLKTYALFTCNLRLTVFQDILRLPHVLQHLPQSLPGILTCPLPLAISISKIHHYPYRLL